MSHNRGCFFCGRDIWEYDGCDHGEDCVKKDFSKMLEKPINTEFVNDRQVGGNHYKTSYEHWDWVIDNNMGYLEGCATKYVSRWRKKNGVQDLEKAAHYIQKIIESFEKGKYPSADSRIRDQNIKDNALRSNKFDLANELQYEEGLICWTLSSWREIESLLIAQKMVNALLQTARDAAGLQSKG